MDMKPRVSLSTAILDVRTGGASRHHLIQLIILSFVLLAFAGCSAMVQKAPPFSQGALPVDESRPMIASADVGHAYSLRSGDISDRYVVLISVDGLRPDAVTRQSADRLPNFYRMREEGAFTDNARTDVDYINTLPNHIAQLTGRPVLGETGHNWTSNGEPGEATLHSRKGEYISSIFDVVDASGLRSGAYVSKSKLAVFNQSYDGSFLDKSESEGGIASGGIDRFVYNSDSEDLVQQMVSDLRADPTAFTFLHIRDPDSKGHVWSWSMRSWSPYMSAVRRVDRMLGYVLDGIESDPRLAGKTMVILTSDHGGKGWGHGDKTQPEDYTIPFYVWGGGIGNTDLYEINAQTRRDPGGAHPGFDAEWQPIRNSDAANLAASLLGLNPVPGSIANAEADLRVGLSAVHLTEAREHRGSE